MEAECGSYCFKAVRIILEHTMSLQKQVDGHNEILTSKTLEKLDSVEKHLRAEDEKIDNLARTLNITLKTQIDNIAKSIAKSEVQGSSIRKNVPGKVFIKIGSKYYYIERNEKVNWFAAVQKCLALGSHLASLQSQDEMNALLPHLQTSMNYWIDLNDLATEGNFLSIANGLAPKFLNWTKGNPSNSNGNEHCGELHYYIQFLMNDNVCSKHQMYICESAN